MAGKRNPRFEFAPMNAVAAAAHVASASQHRQRMREAVSKQPGIDVLDGEWRKNFSDQRAAGQTPEVSLWDAVQRYCEVMHKTKHARRFRAIRNGYLRALEILGRDTLVHNVTNEELLKYRDYQLGRGWKVSTVNRNMSSIYMLLLCCRDVWGLIDSFPRIKPLKEKQRQFRFLNHAEEQKLLAAAPVHLHRFMTFILGTGARKAEAIGLTWNDVYLHRSKRSWVRFPVTKNGRSHAVPLPTHVATMLRRMKKERHPEVDYVFTYLPEKDSRRYDGRVYIRAGVPAHFCWPDRDFNQTRTRAGVKNITIHGLRHTYASRLVMNGVGVFDVARLLNHASLSSTLHYLHLAPEHLENAISSLDK